MPGAGRGKLRRRWLGAATLDGMSHADTFRALNPVACAISGPEAKYRAVVSQICDTLCAASPPSLSRGSRRLVITTVLKPKLHLRRGK
jgi:hypothetical protein